jgi:hypothetical protein
MTALKILFAAALIGIGAGWAFYWVAMSVLTTDTDTDTDTVNSLTWRAWGIVALGALPVGGGIYLLFHL